MGMEWDDNQESDMDSVLEEMTGESFADMDTEIDPQVLEALEGQENTREGARIRLAQGRLYESLLSHDLFGDDTGEDPRAVRKVQSEIRAFVLERLEIMLNLRKEKIRVPTVKVRLPFNDIEIQVVKDLAAKLSKGASLNEQAVETELEIEEQEVEKPRQAPRPSPVKKVAPQRQQPTYQKAQSPIVAGKKLAKTPQPPKKDPRHMTEAELEEYAKNMPRPKQGVPSGVQPIPMPDPHMMDFLAAQAAQRNAGGGSATSPENALIQNVISRRIK